MQSITYAVAHGQLIEEIVTWTAAPKDPRSVDGYLVESIVNPLREIPEIPDYSDQPKEYLASAFWQYEKLPLRAGYEVISEKEATKMIEENANKVAAAERDSDLLSG